jgi:hypothetical protein
MAASVKEVNVMDVSHSSSLKSNLRPVLHRIINVLNMEEGQGICDKCRKTIANLPTSFGNESGVSSSSEYDINEKEGLKSFKIA